MDKELNIEETEIIKKLKKLGKEIAGQNPRSTAMPLWCDRSRDKYGILHPSHCFSFFESDVEYSEDNYVLANYDAEKMNELRKLLVELAGEDTKYF